MAIVPFLGWWILILFAVVAINLGTLERRLRRSARPELLPVQSMLLIVAVLAVGVGFSGGQQSPALPWLILPVATAAARFRPQVVVAGAGVAAAPSPGCSTGPRSSRGWWRSSSRRA